MRILYLTIKSKWFFEILSGTKIEEYREVKPFWTVRLSKEYDVIIFRNGYKKESSVLEIEFKGVTQRMIINPLNNKFENVYVISLGKINWVRNAEQNRTP